MDVCLLNPKDKTPEITRKYGPHAGAYGVYILMNADGEPLYVGQTGHWVTRRWLHTKREWWPQVTEVWVLSWHDPSVSITEFWDEVKLSEEFLIRMLCPKYNRAHHPKQDYTSPELRARSLKGWETRRRKAAERGIPVVANGRLESTEDRLAVLEMRMARLKRHLGLDQDGEG